MSDPIKITFGIITLNEEKNLARCLSSIQPVADEILIIDSYSTDGTRDIARSFNANWSQIAWPGYVEQKNNVLMLASHEWVFSIDADEALSPQLLKEIEFLKKRGITDEINGFSMPRCVFYEGAWIRHGDWYPDRLTRLFRRGPARFSGGRVHERLELCGKIASLNGEIEHYSFSDAQDHRNRCQKYARLWAEDKFESGRQATWFAPYLRSAFRWFRGYILRGGFLDGRRGRQIAGFSAYEVYLKYKLLRILTAEKKFLNTPSV
jgi:glycosyltransferase involved in cell wall biosynthesis